MSTVAAVAPGSASLVVPATWRDLNAVRQIENACFPKDAWPLWDVIGVLTLPNVVRLKAVVDGQMVGFIASDIRAAEQTAWIATIGVLPEYRNRGIGTSLLRACEASLSTQRVRLNVRVSNESAIHLYQGLGYSHVGIWSQYYPDGEDALILEKKLHDPSRPSE
jgi:ribosomal-protein-alanine N-acetyltransferase